MPKGKPKRGEFDFTIWLEDGARLNWFSTRSSTDGEIAKAIRKYLVPIMERIESRKAQTPEPPAAPEKEKLP